LGGPYQYLPVPDRKSSIKSTGFGISLDYIDKFDFYGLCVEKYDDFGLRIDGGYDG